MPDDRKAIAGPTRRENLGKEIGQGFRGDDRLRVAVRKITIPTIDVAERGRLDDQQLYSGHAALVVRTIDRPTSCATNYSKGSNSASYSSWANPNRGDALPS